MKGRFLLDTHVFIWAAEAHGPLSEKARKILLHPEPTLFLSLASVWEIQIKLRLKKLKLPLPLRDAIQKAVTDLGIELLPLQPEHIYQLNDLPFHHRDPFDRLLIAQALSEHLTVLGHDKTFDAYNVPRAW